MKRLAGFIIVCLALSFEVWADRVYTRTGQVLRGKADFATDGSVSVGTSKVPAASFHRAQLDAPATESGLRGVTFKTHLGEWAKLEDFRQLPVDLSGRLPGDHLNLESAGHIFNFKMGDSLLRWTSPLVEQRPFIVSATVTALGGDGVILAHGGNREGYAIYLKGGHLHFVLRMEHQMITARDETPMPMNRPVKITAALRRDFNLQLTVDDREAALTPAPGLIPRQPLEGVSVGFDQRPTLVGHYPADNHFQGTLENVQVRLMGRARIYTGQLHIVTPGRYTFKVTTDAATRLEIGGRRVLGHDNPTTPTPLNGSLDLAAGSHEFGLVHAQLNTPRTNPNSTQQFFPLQWAGPGIPQTVPVPNTPAHTWYPGDIAIPAAGVLTTDGAFIAKPVETADSDRIYFSDESSTLRFNVSMIFFRPITLFEARKLADKPAGILELDGTFTECRLRKIEHNTLSASSVLFGLRKFKPGIDAVAMVLRPTLKPLPGPTVNLHDGSILNVRKYIVQNAKITLTGTGLPRKEFPLSQVATIHTDRLPHPFQTAEARWESHSELGRHFLGERHRKIEAILKQYKDWQLRQAAGERAYHEAIRNLPDAEKAAAEALARLEKVRPPYEAVAPDVQLKAKAYEQTRATFAAAEKKLDDDCSRNAQAHQALQSAIESRLNPSLQKLAEANWDIILHSREPINQGQLNGARSRRDAALRSLDAANRDIANLRQKYREVIKAGAPAHEAEFTARNAEEAAWEIHHQAQMELAKVAVDYDPAYADYTQKKSHADHMRNQHAHSQREIENAKAKLEALKPTLQLLAKP